MKMRRMAVATRGLVDEMGRQRQFCYDLIIDIEEGERFAFENYGIGIRETGGDEVVIRGITLRAERIDELLTLLVDGVVSPIAVRDVVADWL